MGRSREAHRERAQEQQQQSDDKAAAGNVLARVPTPARGGDREGLQASPQHRSAKAGRHWQHGSSPAAQASKQRHHHSSWEPQQQSPPQANQNYLGAAPPSTMSYRDWLQAKGQQLLQRRGSGPSSGTGTPTNGIPPGGVPPQSPMRPVTPPMLPIGALAGPMPTSPVAAVSPATHQQYPDGSPVHSGTEEWFHGWRQSPDGSPISNLFSEATHPAMTWNAWAPEGITTPASATSPYCWMGSPSNTAGVAAAPPLGWPAAPSLPDEGLSTCQWPGMQMGSSSQDRGSPGIVNPQSPGPYFWQSEHGLPKMCDASNRCSTPLAATPQAGLDSQLLGLVMPQANASSWSSEQIAELLQAAANEGGQYED